MMPLILLAALAVSANAVPFGIQRFVPRIVGGHDAEIEDFPYQVSLQSRGSGHLCGASIISKDYILTAAHCVSYQSQDELRVRSGSAYYFYAIGQPSTVSQVVAHADYDIAVVKIQPPFFFDEIRQPIEMATKRPEVGSLANVTGWGHLKENGNKLSDKLQVVEVPVISEKDCSKAYKKKMGDHEICAGLLGVGGKDTCQSDSGGPLVVDNLLAGVVSWGWGCGRPESPGVYVDVAYLRNWIREQTGV